MTETLMKSITSYNNYKLLHLLNKDLPIFDMLFNYLKNDDSLMSYIYELTSVNKHEVLRKSFQLMTKNYLNEKYRPHINSNNEISNEYEGSLPESVICNQVLEQFTPAFTSLIDQLIRQIQTNNLFDFDPKQDFERLEKSLRLLCEYKLSMILESYLPKKQNRLFTDDN